MSKEDKKITKELINSTARIIEEVMQSVMLVPSEILEKLYDQLCQEEAIGPLLRPSEFVSGTKFDEISNRKARIKAFLDFKKEIIETNMEI